MHEAARTTGVRAAFIPGQGPLALPGASAPDLSP
jgi:hypothetical protein